MRRQPAPYQREIDKHVEQLLHQGAIETAKSEWASNVVLANKKDGSLTFCLDYRKLNSVTRGDSYPLPGIDSCLDALSNTCWFSTLDLRSGYHQVMLKPEDADKTAFVTRKGIFRWRVMPMGLVGASATFQRTMDIVLSGLNFEICLVYLDDIIIFSDSVNTHLERLQKVFERLRVANLKLRPDKCKLLKNQVQFLGHVVSVNGIEADPSKVAQVKLWPIPKCLRDDDWRSSRPQRKVGKPARFL